MSEEAARGRRSLLWFLSGMILLSACVIGFYIAVKGTGKLPTQIVRFVLTIGLCCWVYSGSVFAKRITIVLAVLAGFSATVIGAMLSPFWLALGIGVMGNFYTSLFHLLWRNADVNAFLAYQRGVSE
jgi:hypothetical protein